MIWVPEQKPGDKESVKPITVACDSAVIEFNEKYSWDNANENLRVIKGQLRGKVEINGDKGLHVSGNNFVYSEEAMSIVCDDKRIRFHYNGTDGVADGLVINLEEDNTLKQSGQIPVKGVSQLRLRENVNLEYHPPLDPEDPTGGSDLEGPVTISSQGSLLYDLTTNVAQLFDNVQIHRQTKPGESEHLYAPDSLTIELEQEETQEPEFTTNQPTADDEKSDEENQFSQIRRIRATGQPVRLMVEKQNLLVETVNLVYDYKARTAVLNGPGGVSAQMKENHLECPELQLIHNEDNDIESVIGLGRGKLIQLDEETAEIKFQASWMKRVYFLHDFPSDQDIVQLDEQAYFEVPEQNFGATANQITVRLEEWAPPADPTRAQSEKPKRQPVYVRAADNVQMKMDQMEARNELTEVWIKDLTFADAAQRKITPEQSNGDNPGGIIEHHEEQEKRSSNQFEDPMSVNSRSMKIMVNRIHPDPTAPLPESGEKPVPKYELQDAEILEKVIVKRSSPEANKNLAIAGNRVRFASNPQGQETITVLGTPAEVQGPQAYLTGNQLVIHTETEEAEVIGGGQLRLDIRKDMEGKDLEVPDKLTIKWHEKMVFGDKTASFYGHIDASSEVNQSQINCQIMHVHFTDNIALSNDDETDQPDIELIECLEQVRLFSKQYEKDTLTEIRKGEVWEMRIHPETGETESIGPGYFEIWSQQQNKNDLASLSSKSKVMSNQSLAVDDSRWKYIRVDFNRSSKGNLLDRSNSFDGGVEMIYGPVQHPQQVIRKTELSEESGAMESEKLDIRQVKKSELGTGKEEEYVELFASGNVRLESDKFHARAELVSYDQSKERYELKSRGSEFVDLWEQKKVGGEWNRSQAKEMTYYPLKNQVSLGKVQILQGGQE
ncbi:MAG: hypothetical protein R3C11_02270 [Planctomycetaceae bacterium]